MQIWKRDPLTPLASKPYEMTFSSTWCKSCDKCKFSRKTNLTNTTSALDLLMCFGRGLGGISKSKKQFWPSPWWAGLVYYYSCKNRLRCLTTAQLSEWPTKSQDTTLICDQGSDCLDQGENIQQEGVDTSINICFFSPLGNRNTRASSQSPIFCTEASACSVS